MRTKAGFGIAIVGAIVILLGIIGLISGLTNSTVTAKTTSGKAAYVMTDAGVLDLVNNKIHVTLEGPKADSQVSVGVGASEDVKAWSQDLPVFEVTGLKDWQNFAGKELKGKVEDTPEATGSDLWVYEKSGKGKVSFDYTVENPGDTSLIGTSSDGGPLTLTVSWQRPGIVTGTLPYVIIGALMVGIGVVLIMMGRRDSEEDLPSLSKKDKGAKKRKKDAVDISEIDISVPSRDGLVNQRRDEQRHNTGGVLGAGVIPPASEEFRESTAELPRPGNAWAQ